MNTEETLLARITTNPAVMTGKPTVRGTRLTVEFVLEKLGYGASEAELRTSYPFLEPDDIKACLLYAARILAHEEIITI